MVCYMNIKVKHSTVNKTWILYLRFVYKKQVLSRSVCDRMECLFKMDPSWTATDVGVRGRLGLSAKHTYKHMIRH